MKLAVARAAILVTALMTAPDHDPQGRAGLPVGGSSSYPRGDHPFPSTTVGSAWWSPHVSMAFIPCGRYLRTSFGCWHVSLHVCFLLSFWVIFRILHSITPLQEGINFLNGRAKPWGWGCLQKRRLDISCASPTGWILPSKELLRFLNSASAKFPMRNGEGDRENTNSYLQFGSPSQAQWGDGIPKSAKSYDKYTWAYTLDAMSPLLWQWDKNKEDDPARQALQAGILHA